MLAPALSKPLSDSQRPLNENGLPQYVPSQTPFGAGPSHSEIAPYGGFTWAKKQRPPHHHTTPHTSSQKYAVLARDLSKKRHLVQTRRAQGKGRHANPTDQHAQPLLVQIAINGRIKIETTGSGIHVNKVYHRSFRAPRPLVRSPPGHRHGVRGPKPWNTNGKTLEYWIARFGFGFHFTAPLVQGAAADR